jgi:hypothetical protein
MNMKKLVWSFILVIIMSGCTTVNTEKYGTVTTNWYEVELHNLEENPRGAYVYEADFEYPYKEVYLASLNVVRDWGVNIVFRDYDKGVIFVRPALEFAIENGKNFSAPGRECGLFFQKINDIKTKVTLKAVRRFPFYSSSSTAEDVFKAIEKEIQFTKKINE